MRLERGLKLGPYEIVGLLGAGGMGEVYRARDLRLARDVAIKVLPAAAASEPDLLRRFEQEARATGALNHPNIMAIYDVGSHEGGPYVVCELLEGDTIRERLKRGPLPPRKAVDVAVQAARGLAAAHAKGIIHRDIKPENLLVTKDGVVKILDFGLAKLTAPERALVGESPVPNGTIPGAVVGTAGYMSPEQVRGLSLDQRSDIFALGTVLYEMLTGQRAFSGATPADTLSAILTAEPADLERASASVPPGLDRIVRHCLEKEPVDRFQSARDLEFDLLSLSMLTAPTPSPRRRFPRRAGRLALTIGACAAVGAAAFLFGRRAGIPDVPQFHQLTFRKGYVFSGRFARDGQTLVYGAAWNAQPVELYQTRVRSIESRRLELPSADILSITADDEMAVMLSRRFVRPLETTGTLARASLAGGAPRAVLEGLSDADLSLDGTTLAIVRRADGQQRLEFPSGNVVATTIGYFDGVRISPDGRRLAFLEHPVAMDDRGFVAVAEPGGGLRRISDEWSGLGGLAWHPTTGEIWFCGTRAGENYGLYAVTLSGRERSVLRVPADLRILDISTAGTVLLSRDWRKSEIACRPPGAVEERSISWFQDDDFGGLSSDGSLVAFYTFGAGSGPDYASYLGRTDGSSYVRLGEGSAFGITPDGRWVLGQVPRASNTATLWPTGPGEPKPVRLAGFERIWFGDHCSFSRDGSFVAFRGNVAGMTEGVFVLDLSSGGIQPVVESPARCCLISPDASQVAVLDTAGRLTLHPLAFGRPRLVQGLAEGEEPVEWEAGGRSLYVWDQRFPARIFLLDVTTGQRTPWREIAPADLSGVYWGRVLPTQDGSGFAYRYRRLLSDLYVVEGLR